MDEAPINVQSECCNWVLRRLFELYFSSVARSEGFVYCFSHLCLDCVEEKLAVILFLLHQSGFSWADVICEVVTEHTK